MSATATPQRQFVPAKIDFADFAQIQPLYAELLSRPITKTTDLEKWLLAFSELTAAVDEFGSRRYIDKSCHTDDP